MRGSTGSVVRRLRVRGAGLAVATAIGALAVPAVAGAATITYSRADGGAVVYTADPGEQLNTYVGFKAACTTTGLDCVTFYGDDGVTAGDANAQGACGSASSGEVTCVLDDDRSGVHVVGGASHDSVSVYDAGLDGFPAATPYAIVVDGGGGNDQIVGGSANDTLNGGADADAIAGMGGNDTIDGGDGNDTLGGDSDDQHNDVSEGGNDIIHGGAGDDTLTGDAGSSNAVIGHDLLDGGPGTDTVQDDWYRFDGHGYDADPAPTVTFDGAANDGRPGENDNVVGVEHIKSGAPAGATPATYVGDDGANTFDLLFTNAVVRAGGGDDVITGSDYVDTIDGGAGDDKISGGFDDDTLTGGPGSDDIGGDRTAACFYGPIFGSCTIGSGDDTIYAQDGERDTVNCDQGADTAYVDAVDVVTGCEDVHTAASGQGHNGAGKPRPRLSVPRQHLRKVARARALKVTCRLKRRGRCTVKATIAAKSARKLHLKAKRRAKTFTLGSAHRKLRKAGRATLRIKLSRKTARALRHARSLKVTFKVTARYAHGRRSATAHKKLRR